MKLSDTTILFIPGLNGSGPDHWQTRWEKKLSTAQRLEQRDWDNPLAAEWTDKLLETAEKSSRPVIAVSHSLGSTTLAKAAPLFTPGKIVGAFMVTPPVPEALLRAFPSIDPTFLEPVAHNFPFKTWLIASRNDPFASYDLSEKMALDWAATLIDAGEAGHINTESGHGPWPEGLMSFAGFINKL